MVFINPLLYLGYKLYHRTKPHAPAEVDLHKNLDEVEEYERNLEEKKRQLAERWGIDAGQRQNPPAPASAASRR